ncbi:hypothetical protein HID58_006355 [Brassica napus]|uniref:Uncharacterized protein n=1 Tax=Brassica napus TaxID=3708 RepID=A0ABQ8EB76_BRANA|nr:hypothetical protein HID58_006355 [Brassica napus]
MFLHSLVVVTMSKLITNIRLKGESMTPILGKKSLLQKSLRRSYRSSSVPLTSTMVAPFKALENVEKSFELYSQVVITGNFSSMKKDP